MRRVVLILFLAGCSTLAFAQAPGGGIQFSGVLSANLIDDFIVTFAYADNNSGYTYFQLKKSASYKDGPFGLESQLQFGPAPANTGVSNLYVHYGYGYANLLGGGLYLAVGRIIDISTFGAEQLLPAGAEWPPRFMGAAWQGRGSADSESTGCSSGCAG